MKSHSVTTAQSEDKNRSWGHSCHNEQTKPCTSRPRSRSFIILGCEERFKCSCFRNPLDCFRNRCPSFSSNRFLSPTLFTLFLFAVPERQIYRVQEFLSEAFLSPVSTQQREIPCHLLNLSVMVCISGSSVAALPHLALVWLDFISQPAADKLSTSARPLNINLPRWWPARRRQTRNTFPLPCLCITTTPMLHVRCHFIPRNIYYNVMCVFSPQGDDQGL